MEMKKRKTLPGILAIVGILSITIGVSVAFFNYTRTGAANTVSVGRISFVTRQTQTISLTNLFPIDPTNSEEMSDATKVGTLEIEIEGDTDYVDGVEYLVSSENTNITTSSGKEVPISLDVEITNLGTSSNNYFTAREDKNATIYKKLVGDTLVGDQMLLVGYIKPNTTRGTAEGISNGKLTIKAYLDKNKILISDTYDGTESDNMGTPNSMARGKTVLTTTEWNALSSTGVSFQIKVEANEGIWVKGSLEEIMRKDAVMDNIASDYVTASTGINFGEVSSDTNGKGVYMRAGTENDAYPIVYYRGAVEDNNVLFNNQCWKAVRTTDTGGVKLIYNGSASANETMGYSCDNSGTDSQITLSGKNTFPFSGTNLYKSLAYNGYMWGDVYEWTNSATTSGAYYGTGFTWDGTNYTLTSAKVGYDGTHHYTCNLTTAEGTCSSIRYYYYVEGTYNYYIILTGGDSIEKAIEKMQTNTNPSNAKTQIDTWYAANMSTVTSKLEDTIWCNDRSISTKGAWDPSGNTTTGYLYYAVYDRFYNTHTPSLACTNKNDSFTWKNASGNQKLNYPVAMLTVDEMMLAGGIGSTGTFYLNSGSNIYWSLSPSYFTSSHALEFYEGSGIINHYYVFYSNNGLRPAVSLKPGTPVVNGDGTATSPYVIG